MKVNEVTRNQLVENLKDELANFEASINSYIGDIVDANSVEEIMKAKQELLLTWVEKLPMRGYLCYFCIDTDLECNKCLYKQYHGTCDIDNDSTYARIEDIKIDLEGTINEYYKGEIYKGKEVSKRKTYYCQKCNSKFRRIEKEGVAEFCTKCGAELVKISRK